MIKLAVMLFIHNIDDIQGLADYFVPYNTWYCMIWRDVRKYLKITKYLSVHSPVAHNLDFTMQFKSMGLVGWKSKDADYIFHLYFQDILKSFEQLKEEFDFQNKDQYINLQIRLPRKSEEGRKTLFWYHRYRETIYYSNGCIYICMVCWLLWGILPMIYWNKLGRRILGWVLMRNSGLNSVIRYTLNVHS